MKTIICKWMLAAFLSAAIAPVVVAQDTQGPKQDIKDAGSDTKSAAKKTGRATKKAVHKSAKKTKEGADKVQDKTQPQ